MKKQFFSILMLLSVATSVVATEGTPVVPVQGWSEWVQNGISSVVATKATPVVATKGTPVVPVQGWSEWAQNGISSFGKNIVKTATSFGKDIKQTCDNNPKTAIAVVGGVAAVGLGYVAYNRYFKQSGVYSPVLPQLESDIATLNNMLLVDELAADKSLVFKTDADGNVDSKGKLYLYEIKGPNGKSLDLLSSSFAIKTLEGITLESVNTMTLTTHPCGDDGQIVKATITTSSKFEVSFCIERKEVIAADNDTQEDIKNALTQVLTIKGTSLASSNKAINYYILLNGAARQAFDKNDESAQDSALEKREVAALNLLNQIEKAVIAATAADAKDAAEKAKQEAKDAAEKAKQEAKDAAEKAKQEAKDAAEKAE